MFVQDTFLHIFKFYIDLIKNNQFEDPFNPVDAKIGQKSEAPGLKTGSAELSKG